MCDVLIVGGGPTGLMAADYLSKLNYNISIVDQMPTMGKKIFNGWKIRVELNKKRTLGKIFE